VADLSVSDSWVDGKTFPSADQTYAHSGVSDSFQQLWNTLKPGGFTAIRFPLALDDLQGASRLANLCIWAKANNVSLIPILRWTRRTDNNSIQGGFADAAGSFVQTAVATLRSGTPQQFETYSQIAFFQIGEHGNYPEAPQSQGSASWQQTILDAASAVRNAEIQALQGASVQPTPLLVSVSFDYELVKQGAIAGVDLTSAAEQAAQATMYQSASAIAASASVDAIDVQWFPRSISSGDAGHFSSLLSGLRSSIGTKPLVFTTGFSRAFQSSDDQNQFYALAIGNLESFHVNDPSGALLVGAVFHSGVADQTNGANVPAMQPEPDPAHWNWSEKAQQLSQLWSTGQGNADLSWWLAKIDSNMALANLDASGSSNAAPAAALQVLAQFSTAVSQVNQQANQGVPPAQGLNTAATSQIPAPVSNVYTGTGVATPQIGNVANPAVVPQNPPTPSSVSPMNQLLASVLQQFASQLTPVVANKLAGITGPAPGQPNNGPYPFPNGNQAPNANYPVSNVNYQAPNVIFMGQQDVTVSGPTVKTGQTVTITANVHNQSPNQPANLMARLIDAGSNAGVPLASSNVMVPQFSATPVQLSWTPSPQDPTGPRNLQVQVVDATGTPIANALVPPITVLGPLNISLAATDITASGATVKTGQTVTITANLHNLTANQTASLIATLIDSANAGAPLATANVTIPQSSAAPAQLSWTPSAQDSTGPRNLQVQVVDATGTPMANAAVPAISVLGPLNISLAATDITASGATVKTGQTVTIIANLHNLTANQTASLTATLIDTANAGTPLATTNVTIPQSSAAPVQLSWTPPAQGPTGPRNLQVQVVDATGTPMANAPVPVITVLGPLNISLAATDITASGATVKTGQTVTVTANLHNQTANQTASLTATLIDSANAGAPLATANVTIPQSSAAPVQLSWTPPAQGPTGPRSLQVQVVDATGTPMANAPVPAISVLGPLNISLAATDITASGATVKTGQTVTIIANLHNLTANQTASLTATLIDSANAGTPLATTNVTIPLSSAAPVQLSWTPSAQDLTGPRNLQVQVVDATGTPMANAAVPTITVVGPLSISLAATDITATGATVKTGQTVTITANLHNQTANQTASLTATLIDSANAGTPLATANVTIPQSSAAPVQLSWTPPAQGPTGPRNLQVQVVDATGAPLANAAAPAISVLGASAADLLPGAKDIILAPQDITVGRGATGRAGQAITITANVRNQNASQAATLTAVLIDNSSNPPRTLARSAPTTVRQSSATPVRISWVLAAGQDAPRVLELRLLDSTGASVGVPIPLSLAANASPGGTQPPAEASPGSSVPMVTPQNSTAAIQQPEGVASNTTGARPLPGNGPSQNPNVVQQPVGVPVTNTPIRPVPGTTPQIPNVVQQAAGVPVTNTPTRPVPGTTTPQIPNVVQQPAGVPVTNTPIRPVPGTTPQIPNVVQQAAGVPVTNTPTRPVPGTTPQNSNAVQQPAGVPVTNTPIRPAPGTATPQNSNAVQQPAGMPGVQPGPVQNTPVTQGLPPRPVPGNQGQQSIATPLAQPNVQPRPGAGTPAAPNHGSVDLAVSAADIHITPPPPRAGQPATFTAMVHNLGTSGTRGAQAIFRIIADGRTAATSPPVSFNIAAYGTFQTAWTTLMPAGQRMQIVVTLSANGDANPANNQAFIQFTLPPQMPGKR
jgi:hypothetical protein